MILSIIVPHYKESEEMISHLLTSINEQVLVDFSNIEVVIVNDGSEAVKLSNDFIKSFKNLNIKQYFNDKNVGVALTRNKGLELASGMYVMFCDSDDMFLRLDALYRMLLYADNVHQLIAARWSYMDYWNNDRSKLYDKSEYDATNIHCKMILRRFLNAYEIKFPDLRCHEDTYFMGCVFDMHINGIFIPESFYFYGDNSDSLTRQNQCSFMNSTWWMFHISVRMMLDKVSIYYPEKIPWKIMQYSIYSFFEFNNPDKFPYVEEMNKAFKLFSDNVKAYEKQLLENSLEEVDRTYREVESWMHISELKESYRHFIRRALDE